MNVQPQQQQGYQPQQQQGYQPQQQQGYQPQQPVQIGPVNLPIPQPQGYQQPPSKPVSRSAAVKAAVNAWSGPKKVAIGILFLLLLGGIITGLVYLFKPSLFSKPKPIDPTVNWKGYKYSTDGKCGPVFGNTACPGNQCCSSNGYCGGTKDGNDAYCGTEHGYVGYYDDQQPSKSHPTTNWKGYATSTDGRCGPDFNNKGCGDSSCCSTLGYCGGVTGGADAWCKTMNLSNGIYDAVEPPKK